MSEPVPPAGAPSEARRGALLALAAAALFGASAPLSKTLLPEIGPLALAGVLYLGAGIGLSLLSPLLRGRRGAAEARLSRADLPLLAGVVLAGGIVAPAVLLFGLARTTGVVGSLLLNLETPFTVLLAVLVFGEHLSRRGWTSVAVLVAGGSLLALGAGGGRAEIVGALAVAAACLCWAVDNNLTQRLSGKDPVAVARVKCLVAGSTNLGLSLLVGGALPDAKVALLGSLLGLLSFGLSLVLATRAMRAVGAARFAAFFATAPFVGALVAIPVLSETPGPVEGGGMALMALGIWLLFGERHSHLHVHAETEHEHIHRHDDHHRHAHVPADPPGEPHSHPHRHEPLVHEHAHVSDLHHRHDHREAGSR